MNKNNEIIYKNKIRIPLGNYIRFKGFLCEIVDRKKANDGYYHYKVIKKLER